MTALAAASKSWRKHAQLRAAPAFIWRGHTVEMGASHRALEAEWRELEAGATASVFQGFDFIDAWCRDAAAAAGEKPLFVTGRSNGALRFVLPLAITRCAGARTLKWLAQSHANYGMALMHRDVWDALDAAGAEQLMAGVARRCAVHVVHLAHQPTHWAGRSNAFAAGSGARLTANDTFVLALDDDFQAQYQRLFSARTRSGLKRKQRRLQETGVISFAPPSNPNSRLGLIDWFVTQKRDQLAEDGQRSVFDEPAIGALYKSLASNVTHFEIDQLAVEGKPVAVALTMRSGSDACLINTAHLGADFARFSPGALLLHQLITSAHERGVRTFDFGPGAVPYKLEWEPLTIPLMSTTVAMSPWGLPVKTALSLASTLKCRLKRDDRLRTMVFSIRRRLGRICGGGQAPRVS